MRQISHFKGGFQREVNHWGEVITCDHMVQAEGELSMGIGGMRDVLTVKDLGTGLKWGYPVPSKSSEHTARALSQF